MVHLLTKENLGTGVDCLALAHRIEILGRRRKSLEDEIQKVRLHFEKHKI
jgi:hypothetical protein